MTGARNDRCSVSLPEARRHKLGECAGAVADGVLRRRLHLAEGQRSAARQEHRVVAETTLAARGPHRLAIDPADKRLGVPVRPGEAQRRDEPRTPVRRCRPSAACTRAMAAAKSLSGPAQRAECTPGAPPSAATQKPESSASAGNAARRRRCQRLDPRVADEVRRVLLGFGQAEGAGGDTPQMPYGRSRSAISRSLPGLWVATTSLPPGRQLARHQGPTASRWAANSSPVPFRANPSSSRSCASENAARSAVACTSTRPPPSVSTKLASASAVESSS